MKKYRIFILGLLLAAAMFSSCSLLSPGFTFENDSSYTVTISISGEDDIVIESGASDTYETRDLYIQFLYTPANLVDYELTATGLFSSTVTFTDK